MKMIKMDSIIQNIVSSATLRNWTRLHTDSTDRLTNRVNKVASKKIVLPKNYIKDSVCRAKVEKAVTTLSQLKDGISDIIYTLCICKLQLFKILDKDNVRLVLNDYQHYNYINNLNIDINILNGRYDSIGYIYQALNSEGNRNSLGQYYTSKDIVLSMVNNISLENKIFLDPCCGSGSFLMNIDTDYPENLYGVDIDILSVLITKTNLLCKYKNIDFIPNIYCFDFLANIDMYSSVGQYRIHTLRFDYIFTNPPWGTDRGINHYSANIFSKEKTSLFLEKSVMLLKKGGCLKFLMPSSILKIKNHKDIRKFILKNTIIKNIRFYDKSRFSGVFTDFVSINIENNLPPEKHTYIVQKENLSYAVSVNASDNDVISTTDDIYGSIWNKVYELRNDDLSHSVWGLGIVTGDNKNKLVDKFQDGYECVYTGKEILKYRLSESSKYLYYDRASLQQCAKDEIYRAKEKLIYKFISKIPVFAYDNRGRLFLNSANILIPSIESMSIKSVMAMLNSELYQFLYMQKFDDVKVLKGNLSSLPFPKLTTAQDKYLRESVDLILDGQDGIQQDINMFIYKLFNIQNQEIYYIKDKLYGATY